MKTGIDHITEARAKQPQKGFDKAHDDEHTNGELIEAAMAFATCGQEQILGNTNGARNHALLAWPWDAESFHPSSDPIKNLAKAGALIAAEIERIDRIDPTR